MMNIVFNKYIFSYLRLFYSSTKYFHEFQSIFVNFCFTNIFVKISTDISDISVITDIFFFALTSYSLHVSCGLQG